MLMAYATVAVFGIVAAGFVLVSMLIGKLLRPNNPTGQKLDVYECGEAPETQAWFNFNPRFYVVALVFLVFDVEIAFLYPVAMVFKRWVAQGLGAYAAAEMFAFVLVLLFGLVYVWKKGDLEWVRTIRGGARGAPITVARSRAGEPIASSLGAPAPAAPAPSASPPAAPRASTPVAAASEVST